MGPFKVVFLVVVFILFIYVAHQLTRFTQMNLWLKLAIVLVLFLSAVSVAIVPLLFLKESGGRSLMEEQTLLLGISYGSMVFLSFILFFVVSRDLLAFPLSLFQKQSVENLYSTSASIGFIVLSLLFLFMGRVNTALGPQIVKKEVDSLHWKENGKHLKIVQISDLHISSFVSPLFVEKVVEKVNEEHPDLVVLTGDIVDGSPIKFQSSMEILRKLKSRLGVYYAPGNHEYYWEPEEIHKSLENQGIQLLINKGLRLNDGDGQGIFIGGVSDPAAKMKGFPGPNLQGALEGSLPEDFKILLAHQPSLFDEAVKEGVHLQLSGHTHGGQFFPWTLFIPLFQKYSKGFYNIQSNFLYVNQGTAYWGPPVRLGTFCEITSLTLKSKSFSAQKY